jgi:hypothetical protein
LADVLKPPIASYLNLGDRPWHARGELAESKSCGGFIEAIQLLEEGESVNDHQQRMKQVPVVAKPITAAGDRLRILSLDRQVEIVRYVFDNLIAGAVGGDVPAVAADRQSEGQQQ